MWFFIALAYFFGVMYFQQKGKIVHVYNITNQYVENDAFASTSGKKRTSECLNIYGEVDTKFRL
ncbi:hypothetical protein G6Z92_06215 [Vibrio aestuarianus subsp. cardii]|uniref:hypothetical protein n=1 Tax=Vibrio aestuarianus TaxID=28171 RepID=UPI0015C52F47|nr:hypothetical protein [Vibrio aestuarianus]NGZ66579.1 hypothetical protein [Vibrio aestuarianus subsp. cardii]